MKDDQIDLSNAVFASIDVERFEFKQSAMTELGMSIFTMDSEPVTHHFIVREHRKYKNKRYVPCHIDNFLFGKSTPMRLAGVEIEFRRLMKGVDYIVGQGVKSDLTFLRDLFKMDIHDGNVFDTQKIYHKRVHNNKSGVKTGLSNICEYFGIEPLYTHNAGNDARYQADIFKKLIKFKKPTEEINHQIPESENTNDHEPKTISPVIQILNI